jgi:hypothetical protein
MTTETKADACKCCDDGIGLERQDGHVVGRDPREMTPSELKALGHEPMTPLKVIRARCLDCCAGSAAEVRTCTAVHCPSWPYRMATSPFRAPLGEEEKSRRAMQAKKMRLAQSDPIKSKGSAAKSAGAGEKDHAGTVDLEHDED